MPWKLEQNIFPHKGRQVHAVVNHGHAILTVKRQMARPVGNFDAMLKGFQAADTPAFQNQVQMTLHEQAIFQFLNLQIMLERVADPNDLVKRVNVQLPDGQAACQTDVVRLQMAQIYGQRHNTRR